MEIILLYVLEISEVGYKRGGNYVVMTNVKSNRRVL